MLVLADLVVPRTQAAIKSALIQSLRGISPVAVDGPGLGIVRATGTGKSNASIVIRIATTGNVGGGEYELSTDGGLTFGSPTTIPSAPFLVGSTGAIVSFSDSALALDSFYVGTRYSFMIAPQAIKYTAWQRFTVGGRFLELESEAGADLEIKIANIAKGGFGATAKGSWLDLYMGEIYDEIRIAALHTQGTVIITDSGSGGPYSPSAGDIVVANSDGTKRFISLDALDIPLGGSAPCRVQAESAGIEYNLANGAISTMSTALPGVVVSNPSRIDPIISNPIGAPAIVISGDPIVDGEIFIEMADATHYRWSLDSGATWEESGIEIDDEAYALGTTGVSVAFDLGETYVIGHTYSVSIGVSWISSPGTDEETDEAYYARGKEKWATLGAGQPDEAWYKWATEASELVMRVFVRASETVPGNLDVIIAGVTGALAAEIVASVDAALQGKAMLPTVVETASAANLEIALAGTIYVSSAYYASAESAVGTALATACASVPIGGLKLDTGPGIVSIEALKASIQNVVGVLDSDLTPTDDIELDWNEAPVVDVSGITFERIE